MWRFCSLHCSSSDPTALQALLAFRVRTNSPLIFSTVVIVLQSLVLTALLLYTMHVENRCRQKSLTSNSSQEVNLRILAHIKQGEGQASNYRGFVPGDPQRLFFNRVPKCGSSALVDLTQKLSKIHNFTFARSTVYMKFYLSQHEQKILSQRFLLAPTPLFYERHLHFLKVSRFTEGRDPMYINLIRDPLDRLVSWYYFRRFQPGHQREMPNNKRIRSYDECVLGNYSECVDPLGNEAEEGYFKIIPFFCGQEDFCRIPGERSLLQAISNVKKHFALVGVVELFEDVLEALEYLLPGYYKGAKYVYKLDEKVLHERHSTTYKLPLSRAVAAVMSPKLQYEYQFYHYIRNKLQQLVIQIKSEKSNLLQ